MFRADLVRRSAVPSFAGAALAVLVAGCSSSGDAPAGVALFPVKGAVVLESGKPVTAGRVVFVSADGLSSSSGEIGPDGTFSLKTSDRDGAPAGDYKARIEAAPVTGKPGRLPFASRYTDEDLSGLRAAVAPGPNDLKPFSLSTKEPPAQSGRGRG